MNDLISLLPASGVSRFICDAIWQSSLIGVITLVAIRCLVKRPAQRAWLASVACVLCFIAPLATWSARSQGVGFFAQQTTAVASQSSSAEFAPAPVISADMLDVANAESNVDASKPFDADLTQGAVVPAITNASSDKLVSTNSVAIQSSNNIQVGFAEACICIWLLLTVLLTIRLVMSAWSICRLCRGAVECQDPVVLEACKQAATAMEMRGVPKVLVSDATACPAVVSWPTPRLLIPRAVSERSVEHWRGVFVHELAHVQRWDGWTRILVEMAAIVLPWQPIIWWMRREFRLACEEACDQWAVYAGADPIDYASCLTEWIPRRANVFAPTISSWRSFSRRRIESLLSTAGRPDPTVGKRWFFGIVGSGFALMIILALLQHSSRDVIAAEVNVSKPSELKVRKDKPIPSKSSNTPSVAKWGEPIMRHSNLAHVLGFSEDGQHIVSSSDDNSVAVWNAQTGKKEASLRLPRSMRYLSPSKIAPKHRSKFFTECVLAPEGESVLVGRADGRIDEVKLSDKSHRVLMNFDAIPWKLAVGPNRRWLAVQTFPMSENPESKRQIIVADLSDRSETQLQPHAIMPVENNYRCLAIDLTGTLLATGESTNVTLWSVTTGQQLWQRRVSNRAVVSKLSFSFDGSMLASCIAGEQTTLLETTTGETRSTIAARNQSVAEFTPSGDGVVTASSNGISLCRVVDASEMWMTRLDAGGFPSIKFDPIGDRIAVGLGSRIAVVDLASGKETGVFSSAAKATSMAVDQANEHLIVGYENGTIEVSDLKSRKRIRAWNAHSQAVEALKINSDGNKLLSVGGREIGFWNPETGSGDVQGRNISKLSWHNRRTPYRVGFATDGVTVVVMKSPREIQLVDWKSRNVQRTLQTDDILPYAAVSDGRHLIAASRSQPGALLYRDIESKEPTRLLKGASIRPSTRTHIALNDDGNKVAYGSQGSMIRVWNLDTDKFVDLIGGHSARFLGAVAFEPNGKSIASGAEDGRVQLWNSDDGTQGKMFRVGPTGAIVRSIAWNADATQILALTDDGVISVIDVTEG